MAKREVITHTKLKRLKRHLGLEDWGALGVLEALWHLTAREARLGDIGKLQNEDIADAIGWRTDPDALIAALVSAGWVDEHPTHRLVIHDWAEHSDDTLHAQVARKREWFADGAAPRLARLNSSERTAAAAFYTAGPATETPEAQAQAPTGLPEHSESLLGESGSTPTRQEVPKPSTMPCHAYLPQTPQGDCGGGGGANGNGNGYHEPPDVPDWPAYRNALFRYFGRDPLNREWDTFHDNLEKYDAEGLLPPIDGWEEMCRVVCDEVRDDHDGEMPKTVKPLLDCLATEVARQREVMRL